MAILLYIGFFSLLCLWKYGMFGYDGLDLAIFNNVFWHTARGQLFMQSIHPHSYLGDHAGFGLLALVPFYWLWSGPKILLILQTIALGVAAWPLYLLAKRRFVGQPSVWSLTPLFIALAWLLNPLVHNINLYEFHLLPFALVPLLFMLLAYEDGRKWRFLLFAAAAMLFREDVSFVVAAVGVLAMLEKKSWWWRIMPILFGAVWFLAATKLVALLAPSGNYKFLVYYSWLTEVPNVGAVFSHLLSAGNLEMLIGFGLPLIFLPYVSPKRLVLAAGPLTQILLGAPGGSAIVLQTHYATLFLPALFAATIFALKDSKDGKLGKRNGIFNSPAMLGALLLTSIYGALTLGPLAHLSASAHQRLDALDAQQIVWAVPDDAAVAASYNLLPHLSSRGNVFSAHYVFLGVEQFATGPYELPTDIPVLLAFDSRDLTTYRAQFLRTAWTKPHYETGRERLAMLAGPTRARGGYFTLYGPPSSSYAIQPVFDKPPTPFGFPKQFSDGTTIDARQFHIDNNRLQVNLTLTLGVKPNTAKTLTFSLNTTHDSIFEVSLPLINELQQGIAPGSTYEYNADILLPSLETGTYDLDVLLSEEHNLQTLDKLGSTTLETINRQEYGHLLIGDVYLK